MIKKERWRISEERKKERERGDSDKKKRKREATSNWCGHNDFFKEATTQDGNQHLKIISLSFISLSPALHSLSLYFNLSYFPLPLYISIFLNSIQLSFSHSLFQSFSIHYQSPSPLSLSHTHTHTHTFTSSLSSHSHKYEEVYSSLISIWVCS